MSEQMVTYTCYHCALCSELTFEFFGSLKGSDRGLIVVLFQHFPRGITKSSLAGVPTGIRNRQFKWIKWRVKNWTAEVRFGREHCYISLIYHFQNDFFWGGHLSLPRLLEKKSKLKKYRDQRLIPKNQKSTCTSTWILTPLGDPQ